VNSSFAGLCDSCVHHRVIENRRGSRFHLCERARTDARFARYPPIPVLRCLGYEPVPVGGQAGPDTGDEGGS
jgi:hypothetical protein